MIAFAFESEVFNKHILISFYSTFKIEILYTLLCFKIILFVFIVFLHFLVEGKATKQQ